MSVAICFSFSSSIHLSKTWFNTDPTPVGSHEIGLGIRKGPTESNKV